MLEIALETSSILAVFGKNSELEEIKFLLCVWNPTYVHMKNFCDWVQDFPSTIGLVAVF
jgi:hypothetical protein